MEKRLETLFLKVQLKELEMSHLEGSGFIHSTNMYKASPLTQAGASVATWEETGQTRPTWPCTTSHSFALDPVDNHNGSSSKTTTQTPCCLITTSILPPRVLHKTLPTVLHHTRPQALTVYLLPVHHPLPPHGLVFPHPPALEPLFYFLFL